MKRNTPGHPKTVALCSALDLPLFSAVGILECLWHFTAHNSPRGNVGHWGNASIAIGCGWTDSPDRLIEALIQTGWLDECPDYRLTIHDWPEHADQTIKRKVGARGEGWAVARHLRGASPPPPAARVRPAKVAAGPRGQAAPTPASEAAAASERVPESARNPRDSAPPESTPAPHLDPHDLYDNYNVTAPESTPAPHLDPPAPEPHEPRPELGQSTYQPSEGLGQPRPSLARGLPGPEPEPEPGPEPAPPEVPPGGGTPPVGSDVGQPVEGGPVCFDALWSQLPPHARRAPSKARDAYEIAMGEAGSEAALIAPAILAYYASPEGSGTYRRGVGRLIRDQVWLESPSAWVRRDDDDESDADVRGYTAGLRAKGDLGANLGAEPRPEEPSEKLGQSHRDAERLLREAQS